MQSDDISPIDMFVLLRDQAYFKTLFFSGDRPGVLGQVKTPKVLRFPNNDGLLFNRVWGKTLRDGSSNLFALRRNNNPVLCPIKAIDLYVTFATGIGIDLTNGYLFRPILGSGFSFQDLFGRRASYPSRNSPRFSIGLRHYARPCRYGSSGYHGAHWLAPSLHCDLLHVAVKSNVR